MIKPSRRFPLLAFLGVLVLASLGGCKSKPVVDNPQPPVRFSNAPAMLAMTPSGVRRRPPLLLSGAVAPLQAPQKEFPAAQTKAAQVGISSALPEQQILLPAAEPPAGFFIPSAVFSKAATVSERDEALPLRSLSGVALTAAEKSFVPVQLSVKTDLRPDDVTLARPLTVGVYISPTSRAYFSAAGIDYIQTIIVPWELFLRQNNIDIVRLVSPASLLSTRVDALILPSAVALDAIERSQLERFRQQGGSILATWLAGVRDEQGQWLGFDFMRQVLDTAVSGTTVEEPGDNFIYVQGDSPLTHQLPAGLRIWLEHLAEWYPLRLTGKHNGLHIMDWSRIAHSGKPTSIMTYDEREGSRPSRVAVLGFPERLWQSLDLKVFGKLLGDTLSWLGRRPDAYLATWPQGRSAAAILAVDVPNPLMDVDFAAYSLAESLGGKATYFLITEHLEKTAPEILLRLRQTKHEISLMADRFEGLKDEMPNAQAKRIALMLNEAKNAGLPVSATPGFHAPMESYDQATNQVLADKGFAYHITDHGITESMLPVAFNAPNNLMLPLLPRSLLNVDDLMNEGGTLEQASQQFSATLRTHIDLGGLSIIPAGQDSPLSQAQWERILGGAFNGVRNTWLASGLDVANWWRERQRVFADVDSSVFPPLLTVKIEGDLPLQQSVSILLNQPASSQGLRLVQDDADTNAFSPALRSLDRWRQSASLQGALPGIYHWYLQPLVGTASSNQVRR